MHHNPTFWPLTLAAAIVAVVTAAAGLMLNMVSPAALAPMLAPALLITSLAATATAFTRLALRVRHIELHNEGLVEEISQEFDSVKDKLEIFSEALEEPRSISPEEVEADTPMRRVMVK